MLSALTNIDSATLSLSLLAALVAGVSGFFIAFKFHASSLAKDTSGDFGAPRGAFLAMFSGILLGMAFTSLLGELSFFGPEAVSVALVVAALVGAVAGVAGVYRGLKKLRSGKP